MSTKNKVLIWIITLLIGTSYWGYMTTKIHFGPGDTIVTIIGMGLGSSLPVLLFSGIISGLVYYFSKNWLTAMWVWTVIALIVMLWLTLGHFFYIQNV